MAPEKRQFPLAVVVQAVDRITAPMRQIQLRLVQAMAPMAVRLASSMGRVRDSLRGVAREVGDLARRFTLLGIGAAAAAGSIIHAFGRKADSVGKTAARLGISVEALQEYRYAADLAGVSQEEFDKSLAQMVRGIGQARAGVGPLVSELGRMSPALLANIQASQSTEEALRLMLEALEQIPDASRRAALAQVAFGEGGRKMVNLALQGTDALRRQREEAHRLGLVIREDATRNAAAYMDALQRVRSVLEGLRNTIGAQVLPVITALMGRTTEFLVGNREKLEAFVRAWADRLPGVLRDLRDRFWELLSRLQPVVAVVQKLAQAIGPLNAVLTLLAATMGAKLVTSLALASKAILGFSAVLLTTPIGWFLAGIAGGAALIVKHWEPIKGFFADLWGTVRGYFSDALGWITEQVQRVVALVPAGLRQRLGLAGSGSGGAGPVASSPSAPPVPNPPMLAGRSEAKVVVEFAGLPRGARVRTERDTGVDLDIDMGYSLDITHALGAR